MLTSLAVTLSMLVSGQATDYDAPSGWRTEVIQLPPKFAPKMTWKGVESLRFAPGMFKPKEKDFFSYTILMKVERPLGKLTVDEVKKEMLAYYRGLASAVWNKSRPKLDTAKFALKLESAVKNQGKKKKPPSRRTYQGTLQWKEPFVTGKSQTLRLTIDVQGGKKQGSSWVFVSASPQDWKAPLWKQLNKIRDAALSTKK